MIQYHTLGGEILCGEDLLAETMYIPDQPFLFEYLTGKENAQYIQQLYKIDPKHFNNYFHKAIVQFKMEKALGELVGSYSTGMRHKLFISAMLPRPCKVLLLDEPFSNLDKEAQFLALQWIERLKNEGVLVLLVSHLDEISEKVATKTIHLSNQGLVEGI